MDKNGYHSPVLQRPPHRPEDDERDRHFRRGGDGTRDGAGAGVVGASPSSVGGATSATSSANAHPHRHSTFSLRSPTQPDFRPPPFPSPNANNASASHPHQSPPRPSLPSLHNPYMTSNAPGASGGPVAPTLPPPGALSSSTTGSHQHHHQGHHQPPPASPLHPPAGYYSPAEAAHHAREKPAPATGRLYDPTTDTTKERRISDAGASWSNANAPPAGTPKVRGQSTSFNSPEPNSQHH